MERDVSYIIVMSRFKREHSAGATTTTFSSSSRFLFCRHDDAHRAAARPSSSPWCCVRVLFCAFQLYHLLVVVSLFLSKVFGVCIGPETTPTRRTRRRKRTNNRRKSVFDETVRFARIDTYILTCGTYIYFFFYETNRQSKERSSRLGSGRSIRIGFR